MNKRSSQELFRRLALGCWYSMALNVSESTLIQTSCVNPNQLQHEEVSSTPLTHALLDNSQLLGISRNWCMLSLLPDVAASKTTHVEAKMVGN